MAKQWFSHNLNRMWLLQRLVPVYKLFKPAEFGPRISSGARAQSSSEGRIKLNISSFDGCWSNFSWLALCSLLWWRVNRILYLLCWNVIICSLFHDDPRSWESSASYQAQQRWEINLYGFRKLQKFVLKSATSGSVSNRRRVINSPDYQAQKLFKMPSWSGLLPRQVY